MELIDGVLAQYPTRVIVWCACALLLGGFVKGVVGVGLPMISVPLMSFVVPPYVAAALVVLPVIPTNLIQLQAGGRFLTKVLRFWPICLGITLGTFASASFLISANPRILQLIVACIVTLYAVQRFRKHDFHIKPGHERPLGFASGLFAGGIGGITMLVGPLIVIYMAALKMDRDVFIGSIAFVYLTTTLAIGAALASVDQLTPTLITASVMACVPAVAGVLIGSWCRRYISQRFFDKLLTVMIVAIAASMFYRALS